MFIEQIAVFSPVMLQPYDHEQASEKNKHKFMVQSMVAPDGTIENQEALVRRLTSFWWHVVVRVDR